MRRNLIGIRFLVRTLPPYWLICSRFHRDEFGSLLINVRSRISTFCASAFRLVFLKSWR